MTQAHTHRERERERKKKRETETESDGYIRHYTMILATLRALSEKRERERQRDKREKETKRERGLLYLRISPTFGYKILTDMAMPNSAMFSPNTIGVPGNSVPTSRP